jgi:hypothetical protein
MGSPKPSVLLDRCAALPWQECLQLYAEMLTEAPDATPILARALREKARAGDMPGQVIPVLVCCLVDTHNPHALSQLAKTLAAFGHQAAMAAPYLVDKIRSVNVTTDETFWALDGALHAASFLGGNEVRALLDDMKTQEVSPVLRAKGLYVGTIPEAERQQIFTETLEIARARTANGKGLGWRGKKTERVAKEGKVMKKTTPWMTR